MIFVYLVAAAAFAVFYGEAMRTANREKTGNLFFRLFFFASFVSFVVLSIIEFNAWLDSINFSDLLKI